jgi:hypothetical protein
MMLTNGPAVGTRPVSAALLVRRCTSVASLLGHLSVRTTEALCDLTNPPDFGTDLD